MIVVRVEAKMVFIRLKESGVRPKEIASRPGIGRASVYRVLANHTGENSHAMVVTLPVQRQPPQFIRSDFRGDTPGSTTTATVHSQ